MAYVVSQRRLLTMLEDPAADPDDVSTAMAAQLDQLETAAFGLGSPPDTQFRSDPGA